MMYDPTTTTGPLAEQGAAPETLGTLAEILAGILGGGAERFGADTELFGALPELDSLALVELIAVIEETFGLQLDGDDITAEVFGSVGSLALHLDRRRAG